MHSPGAQVIQYKQLVGNERDASVQQDIDQAIDTLVQQLRLQVCTFHPLISSLECRVKVLTKPLHMSFPRVRYVPSSAGLCMRSCFCKVIDTPMQYECQSACSDAACCWCHACAWLLHHSTQQLSMVAVNPKMHLLLPTFCWIQHTCCV